MPSVPYAKILRVDAEVLDRGRQNVYSLARVADESVAVRAEKGATFTVGVSMVDGQSLRLSTVRTTLRLFTNRANAFLRHEERVVFGNRHSVAFLEKTRASCSSILFRMPSAVAFGRFLRKVRVLFSVVEVVEASLLAFADSVLLFVFTSLVALRHREEG